MENGNSKWRAASRHSAAAPPIFAFLFSLFAFLVLSGCGVPGEPTPPRQPVPEAVKDLAARQLGDGVLLTFTLPKKAVDGVDLEGPPGIEILREAPASAKGTQAGQNSPRLVFAIPPAMVENYLVGGHVEFRDPLPQEYFSDPAGKLLTYIVRTRASKKRASGDSNSAAVRVYAPPAPPTLLRVDATESALVLTWAPPPAQELPGALPAGFRVYRVEIAAADVDTARMFPEKFKLPKPPTLIGSAPGAEFHDSGFEFGHAYYYTVRAMAQYGAQEVESADSRPVTILPADVFPPASPKNLVAIAVPAAGDAPAHVELSWGINQETDLAGYNVYRSEGAEASGRGERLNKELLVVPAFRDLSAAAGRRYTYRVTAVDRTGNESAPSEATPIEFPPRLP